MSRKQLDSTMEDYYGRCSKRDAYIDNLGISLFKYWCHDQGYDSESIIADLKENPNESAIVDLLKDTFPTKKEGAAKIDEIYHIIKYGWDNPNPFWPQVMHPNKTISPHEKYTLRYYIKPVRLEEEERSKEHVDKSLARYYKWHGREYYEDGDEKGAGKFVEWCEDNGISYKSI